MVLENLIENDIEVLKKSDTLIKGLSLMDEYYVDVLPVIERRKYLGLISINDIIDFDNLQDTISQHIHLLNKFCLVKNASFFNSLKLFSNTEFDILPIVDNRNYYKGYVSARSLLEYTTFTLGLNTDGAILELELNKKDYSLSAIAHVVESNGAILIASFLKENSNPNKINLTIKLNKKNISRVIQSFETNNISIINSLNLSKSEEEDYKDRLDSLMSFLDV